MATAGDIRDDIKADLTLTGSDYDAQILRCIQTALRGLRGRQYWFLEGYSTALACTADSETVDITATVTDFGSLNSMDIIVSGSRYPLTVMSFSRLREEFWLNDPIPTGQPVACAVKDGTLYLSHKAASTYSLPMEYFKQDATLPGASDSSVWFDDGYDAIREMAMYYFKRAGQGMTLEEDSGDMVAIILKYLDDAQARKTVGT